MAVDLLYVAYNRLEYTRQSFAALIDNTNWDMVDTLYIHDDGSTDGTAEYLRDQAGEVDYMTDPSPSVVFHGERLGGPVAAMNWYLDEHDRAPSEPGIPAPQAFAKVDNDFVVCPGWLDELAKVLTFNVQVDILGTEPMLGPPVLPGQLPAPRTATVARHIGGKGLIRHRAFRHCRMVPRGYFGFTEFQEEHPQIVKAWVTPDLPCFGLDQLPFGPWPALEREYVGKGWQRHWPAYAEDATGYWDWWLNAPKPAVEA